MYRWPERAAKRHCDSDYVLRNVDLNTKAGGKYIYLVHRQSFQGEPVRNVSVWNDDEAKAVFPTDHNSVYGTPKWVCRMQDKGMTASPADVSEGAGGDYVYVKFYTD